MNHSSQNNQNKYKIMILQPTPKQTLNLPKQNSYSIPQIQIQSKVNSSRDNQSNNEPQNIQNVLSKPLQIINNKQPLKQTNCNLKTQNIEHNQQQVTKKPTQKNKSFFQQYIDTLKRLIFKRKIILIALNILLTLVSLIFAIYFLIVESGSKDQTTSEIQQLFNSSNSFFILIFILIVAVLGVIFSIIIFKGKIILLHCYWITCLMLLLIFCMIAATTYSFSNMTCESPSNYILQRIRMTAVSGDSLFCSNTCPCNRSSSINSYSNSTLTLYDQVQQCPGWSQDIYSNFLQLIQSSLECSGWCIINQFSYYTFSNKSLQPTSQNKMNCFNKIQQKILQDNNYLKIFSFIQCFFLILIIFYTNYYIFMQKQDEHRHLKKANKKIKQYNKKMQQQLKTSQRMLQ